MIICISGLSGCGKNTVGEIVARKLGLLEVKISFKEEAKRRKMGLMDFQKLATQDEKFDIALDKRIAAEASKGNCVVMTWLGPWVVKNCDFRVWLEVGEEERARRVAKRDGMMYAEALAHVRARDDNNRERYTKYYDINIDDHRNFDMIINGEGKTPDEIADEIITGVKKKIR